VRALRLRLRANQYEVTTASDGYAADHSRSGLASWRRIRRP
jgi:hypothetical protein